MRARETHVAGASHQHPHARAGDRCPGHEPTTSSSADALYRTSHSFITPAGSSPPPTSTRPATSNPRTTALRSPAQTGAHLPPLHHPRPEVLHQHVHAVRQAAQHRAPLLVVQVDRHAAPVAALRGRCGECRRSGSRGVQIMHEAAPPLAVQANRHAAPVAALRVHTAALALGCSTGLPGPSPARAAARAVKRGPPQLQPASATAAAPPPTSKRAHVGAPPQRGAGGVERAQVAQRVAPPRRLHLDHIRSKVRQQGAAEVAGHHLRAGGRQGRSRVSRDAARLLRCSRHLRAVGRQRRGRAGAGHGCGKALRSSRYTRLRRPSPLAWPTSRTRMPTSGPWGGGSPSGAAASPPPLPPAGCE